MLKRIINFGLFKLVQIGLGGCFTAMPERLTDYSRGNP